MDRKKLEELAAMCRTHECRDCPAHGVECSAARLARRYLETERTLERVLEGGKPAPEVIDEAVDVYTIEVQSNVKGLIADVYTPKRLAEDIADSLREIYITDNAVVTSAKRFVTRSHREDA